MKKINNNLWLSVLILIAFGVFIYIQFSHPTVTYTPPVVPAVENPFSQTPPAPPGEAVFCPQDVTMCPDGSYVGRVPPTCEFKACP